MTSNVFISSINVGSQPNDGTGDPLRIAFGKSNTNFTNLANAFNALIQNGLQSNFTALTVNGTVDLNGVTWPPVGSSINSGMYIGAVAQNELGFLPFIIGSQNSDALSSSQLSTMYPAAQAGQFVAGLSVMYQCIGNQQWKTLGTSTNLEGNVILNNVVFPPVGANVQPGMYLGVSAPDVLEFYSFFAGKQPSDTLTVANLNTLYPNIQIGQKVIGNTIVYEFTGNGNWVSYGGSGASTLSITLGNTTSTITSLNVGSGLNGNITGNTLTLSASGYSFSNNNSILNGSISTINFGSGLSSTINGNVLTITSNLPQTIPYDVNFSAIGYFSNGSPLGGHVFSRNVNLTSGLVGSYSTINVQPTVITVLDLIYNGNVVGNISFQPNIKTGTFTLSSNLNMLPGDILELHANNTNFDANVTIIYATLKGTASSI